MASISLLKIAEKMKLENLTPEINLKGIKVTLPDINRPALPMAGYFEHFEATRLQVIGFVEYSYVKRMSEKEEKEMLEKLLDYPIPGIIFCRELHPDELFRQIAIEKRRSASDDQACDKFVYGRADPLAECQAGTLHFCARRTG